MTEQVGPNETSRERVRCPGNWRHWFSVYGISGVRAPVCQRCGAPNPRPLTADEIANYVAVTDPIPRAMSQNTRPEED